MFIPDQRQELQRPSLTKHKISLRVAMDGSVLDLSVLHPVVPLHHRDYLLKRDGRARRARWKCFVQCCLCQRLHLLSFVDDDVALVQIVDNSTHSIFSR